MNTTSNNTNNIVINDGFVRLTFSNQNEEVIAKCKLNPTDVRLVEKCEEMSKVFEELSEEFKNKRTVEDAISFNKKVEDEFSNFLGYDVSSELFGYLSATTILPNGQLFAMVVLDKITEVLKPEINKRKEKMQKNINKYAQKYHK